MGAELKPRERFLAACRGEPVDRPPVWVMRQAGRYLPEYLELRSRHEFWEILRSPELALEVARQPLRRFELDAAIVFSDILVPLDAMGAGVAYDGPPTVGRPFEGAADLARVEGARVARDCAYVGEAVARLAEAEGSERAVIGFAGAPLTLAAYLVEGGPAQDLRRLKGMAYRDPALVDALLAALAEAAADLLLLQVEAGADVVQIFDSWANKLSPDDYERLALPPARRVVERVRAAGVPVALYVRGAASHLEAAASSGCDVLSIDASVRMGEARRRLPGGPTLQGNLDPAELLGPAARIRARLHAMVEDAGRTGLVVNVGQGLTPDIPVAGVEAFVRAAREV